MSKLLQQYGKTFRKGEYLFREGDRADYAYMIHKGSIDINKMVGDKLKRISTLGEGEFVGEMALISGGTRSANAVAAEDCECIRMDRVSFENLLKENHLFAIQVVKMLSRRLYDTDRALAEAMEALLKK